MEPICLNATKDMMIGLLMIFFLAGILAGWGTKYQD